VDGDGYIAIDKGVCAHLIEQASDWESAILDAANLPSGTLDRHLAVVQTSGSKHGHR
jgi:hypothetical protein